MALVKPTDYIPQTAIFTYFKWAQPTNLTFRNIRNIKFKKEENKVNVFTSSSTNSLFSGGKNHLYKLCRKKMIENIEPIDVYIALNSPEVQSACNFIKKGTLAQVFSREFCEISKTTFFYRTPLRDCFCSSKARWSHLREPIFKDESTE